MRLGVPPVGVEEDAMLETAIVVVQSSPLLCLVKVFRISRGARRIVSRLWFKPIEGWRYGAGHVVEEDGEKGGGEHEEQS